jgi:biofilm PGA synthesis N-glycosyltransferase PgaC
MKYALITPARNEADFIEQLIRSVIGQTQLPEKWVIVSDASTDGTDEIVQRYQSEHKWLELVRMPEDRDRSFAAKVSCINAGLERLSGLAYDIIGNLDADITFGPDHLEFLLEQFAANPKLGVAGTAIVDGNYKSAEDGMFNPNDVFGACQLFRRECFEEIGGYLPIKGGGVDWAAVRMARLKGWETRTLPEREFHHYRRMGTAESNILKMKFNYGKRDYYFGGHPLWQAFRMLNQMTRKPYFFGGLLLMLGYCWGFVSHLERPIPPELIRFHRREQMQRLRSYFGKRLGGAGK